MSPTRLGTLLVFALVGVFPGQPESKARNSQISDALGQSPPTRSDFSLSATFNGRFGAYFALEQENLVFA